MDGGGGGGWPHPSASQSAGTIPSSSSSSSSSAASLDGGLLLHLLQNPPPHPHPAAAGAQPQHVFVDPTVGAVGPLFPTQHQPQHGGGGGFAWPSQPQPQPQQRGFPDPRFPQQLDPYAARGGAGDPAMGNRPEKPRAGAPPPGFGRASNPAAAAREAPNTFGGMQQRELNHHHQRGGGGRTPGNEQRAMPHITGGREGFGRMSPGEQRTLPMAGGGRDAPGGIMYREQQHHQQQQRRQAQDQFLSRTPPDTNAPGLFGRMPQGDHHMRPVAGDRAQNGQQYAPQVTGGRMMPHRGQRPQEHGFANMPQREQRWQEQREDRGNASQKLSKANVREVFGRSAAKEQQQMPVPASSSVTGNVRESRGKNMVAEGKVLEDGGVGFEHGVDGRVVVETRKFEVSYQKSEVKFAGQDEKEDADSKDEDAIKQLMESLVIEGNGEAKSLVVQNSGSRNKDFRSDFSRGHNVSSQRARFLKRNRPCRYDIDQFTPSFLSIFESLVPSEEEILKQKQLLTALSELINKEWPNSKLYLYGSCANSFGFSNSDIDLCLSIDNNEMSKVDIILKLAEILEAGNLQNIQALTRARVPIVKLMDPNTGLSCDICVNNLLAVVNTKLLRDYSQIDQRLRQLAFVVKHWAKSRRVNETYQGTLSSYAYVIMCIHLLQLRRILPCLQEMEATYYVTVDDNNCAYFDQVDKLNNYGAQNKDTVSRLLWSFFHYWAYQHDYTKDVISIRTGRIISKHMKDWTRRVGNDRHLICIEDPFETSHDLGRVVDKFSINILKEEFERAANILQFDPNPSVTLFEPHVPPSSGAET